MQLQISKSITQPPLEDRPSNYVEWLNYIKSESTKSNELESTNFVQRFSYNKQFESNLQIIKNHEREITITIEKTKNWVEKFLNS